MALDFEITGPQPGAQTEFLSICQDDGSIVDWVIAGGMFFGGKSIGLAMEAARNVDHPYYRGDIFRRTYKQLTDSGGMCDIASVLYPTFGGVPTDGRLKWTFPSGATILFHHLQHDSDLFNYRSSQFCFLGIDQCEEFPFESLFYLRARNRPAPYYTRPAYSRMTCNPEPGDLADFLSYYWDEETGYHIPERSGHIRYFAREHDRIIWVSKDWRGKDGEKPTSFAYVYLPREQNVKGLERDPDYGSRISGMDYVMRERHGKGNWKINYSGGMFEAEWFQYINEENIPEKIRKLRYWDFAASEVEEGKDPDWTAGVLMGEYGGDIYIKDVKHFRENPGKTIKTVIETAGDDGVGTAVRWEEEKGSAGRFNTSHLSGKLLGYDAKADQITGDKIERAKPLASAAFNRHVYLVKAAWNSKFISEATMFGSGKGKKDQIDASSGALKCLALDKKIFKLFTLSQTVKINIDWNKSSVNIFHYGAVVQLKNGSIYTMAAIWSIKSEKLYIYYAKCFETVDKEKISLSLIKSMKLKRIICNKIIGNDVLYGQGIKNTANLLNKELGILQSIRKISQSVIYDLHGSIAFMNNLWINKGVIISSEIVDAAAQIASWSYKDGKEPEKNQGWCECLCLIASELKREITSRSSKPQIPDYSPVEKPEKEVKSWQVA